MLWKRIIMDDIGMKRLIMYICFGIDKTFAFCSPLR